jgi:hypothetical protein
MRISSPTLVKAVIMSVGCSAVGMLAFAQDPVDNATGLTFGYSFRRLTSSWYGATINVRRASDNARTDIGFVPDGTFDGGALALFCTNTACFLHTFYDQSGNGFDCVQNNVSQQLQIIPWPQSGFGWNGRSSIRTTGARNQMYCTVPADARLDFSGAGHSVFYVLSYTAVTDGGGTANNRGASLEVLSHYNNSTYDGWAADAGDVGRAGETFVFTGNAGEYTHDGANGHLNAMNDGNPHFAGWTFENGTVTIHQDDNAYVSGIRFMTPAPSGQQMTVLAANDYPVDAFFSGSFVEMYGWSTALSNSQITNLLDSARAYYGF